MRLLLGFFLGMIVLSSQDVSAQGDFEGLWTGTLSAQGIDIVIDLEIKKKEKKVLLNIPMQGLKDIESTELIINGDSIEVYYAQFRAQYFGVFNRDTKEILGNWNQGQRLTLNFSRTDKKTEFKRTQVPEGPFPYRIDSLIINNEEENIKLGATLTMPKGKGPFPLVMMVSGSGRQNRDSDILGHKPFWVIADNLSRKGIAVLRYDDRGVGESSGNHSSATTANLATDAEAVLMYAKQLPNIGIVGIAGHSEGGMIAPMIAARNKNVDFIISLAGPGIPITELMVFQNAEVLRKKGMSDKGLKIIKEKIPLIYDIVNQDKEPRELFDTLISTVHGMYDDLPSSDQQLLAPNKASYYMQLSAALFSPWFRYFLAYDPTESWKNVSCDVLALNGDKDIQIEAVTNINAIIKNLEEGQKPKYATKILPGLNHLMQPCVECDLSEYNTIEISFDESVMQLMVEFITKLSDE